VDEADRDLVGRKKGGVSEQAKGVQKEPKDTQGKVLVKKNSRLAEKGAKRKKSKHHGTADKTMVVGKKVAEEVGDEGDEGEQLEEVEEEVAQAEKVAVKKGHPGGSKKTKNTMGVEKEEENLYSAPK
jgi:hypothetical protein